MKYLKLFEDWNILESLSTAREKYLITNQISPEEFNLIKDLDPSKNFKYVEKMIDVYLKDSPNLEELGRVFKDFDEMSKKNQLKNPDITSYRSFSEIVDTTQKTFSEYKEKQDLKSKANEIDVVYEDDKVLVLIPRTHEAVCKYGSGTKWCITEEEPRHYLRYKQNLVTHYFVIMKGLPMSNPNYKMAVSVYENGKLECNDSLDKIIPLGKVLEISGLDKGFFISNPTDALGMELLRASEKGDLEEIKRLIDSGANVNADGANKYTPLHWAAWMNNIALAKLLIEAGADVKAKNSDGETPLRLAVNWDRVVIAKLLIDSGANPTDALNGELFKASNEGDVEEIKRLIDSGADVNDKDSDGYSPLHWAVDRDNVAVAKLLIDAGADVNAKNRWGETPLYRAVSKSNKALVEILISAGAKVNAMDDSEGRVPLHWVFEWGNVALAKLLIDAGADVNAKWDGKTPLHVAVRGGNIALAEYLISAGADVNAKGYRDYTPLRWANSEEMKALLKKNGAVK